MLGERPGRAPSPQPPSPRTSPATSSRHKGSSRAGVTGPWPRAAKRGGQEQGPGWGSHWHRRLPGRTTHSTLPRRLPEESRGSAALRRQGVQLAGEQALPATESPRLPVPASSRSSSPGPGGSKGKGPGWSPQPREAPRCAGLRGASAAGGWRLCRRPRATRSVPGGRSEAPLRRPEADSFRCCS